MGKIVDVFTFFDEIDMLEARLLYLFDKIDFFVVSEGNMTFSGKEKPLNFPKHFDRLRWAWKKLIYYPFDAQSKNYTFKPTDVTDFDADSWKVYHDQFDNTIPLLNAFDKDDLVIIGDLDEIPSRDGIDVARMYLKRSHIELISFKQQMFYYSFSRKQVQPWIGCMIGFADTVIDKTPGNIRHNRWNYRPIEYGGWHLSYWMTPEQISTKLKSFSHQEMNKPEFTDVDIISKRISTGIDPLGRENPLEDFDASSLPPDVREIFGKIQKK